MSNTQDELYHYGVKGMKWGVRRYQNYDGSYTKRGVARFRKAEASYDQAKKNRDRAKLAYKNGTGSKSDIAKAKSDMKTSKREMNSAYKKLRQDKMADQGKALYRKGKTITGNALNLRIAGAVASGGSFATYYLAQNGNRELASVAGAVTAGATAANLILAGVGEYENRRLRAFYAH